MILPSEIRIALQFRLRLQKPPGLIITLRPVFPKDATANLPGFHEFLQTPLHRNTDISARAGRPVSMNHF